MAELSAPRFSHFTELSSAQPPWPSSLLPDTPSRADKRLQHGALHCGAGAPPRRPSSHWRSGPQPWGREKNKKGCDEGLEVACGRRMNKKLLGSQTCPP